MPLDELLSRIQEKQARLAVVGLGYVGLPVACQFANCGFNVLGVEAQSERVEKINAGHSPIEGNEPGLDQLVAVVVSQGRLTATSDYAGLASCEVILICVETPVDDLHIPRYDALRRALMDLAPVLAAGALVIIESTVAPGTMEQLVLPLLQSDGKQVNRDFYLGNCPERVMPGKLLANLKGVSRVVGGMTPETAGVMAALYRHIVAADLDLSDCITAELVKTVENAYRDVQIAFANEVALICSRAGGNVWKVRELVNKSPGRQMHFPGAGVGGHCIPKDPWLLVHSVRGEDLPIQVIPAARATNNFMPQHVVNLLVEALHSADRDVRHARILVMGYTYLEDSDDTRNSPSEVLVGVLRSMGTEVVIHDPYVPGYQGALLDKARGCEAAVVMVKHAEYCNLDLNSLQEALTAPVLVDGRAVFSPERAAAAGLLYRCVGVDHRSG